jgi:hypothetical protein
MYFILILFIYLGKSVKNKFFIYNDGLPKGKRPFTTRETTQHYIKRDLRQQHSIVGSNMSPL